MAGIVRVGDSHAGICDHGLMCCPHYVTGTFIEGSPDVLVNGKGVVRQGDAVEHNCPHCGTGTAEGSDSTVLVNGKPVQRVGDKVVYEGGSGVATGGSEDVSAG